MVEIRRKDGTILLSIDADNLQEAVLREVDLRGADLRIANLRGADLRRADLREADLREANLREVDLWGADLRGADLRKANLQETDLQGANLRRADLRIANLRGADLRRANLWGADLRIADLRKADLWGANLWEADLRGADLREVRTNYLTVGVQPAPEGDLIGWGKKDGKIVKLLIPSEAQRSCATTRKFRAEFALCLEVEGAEIATAKNQWGITEYKPGHWVRPHEWDEDRWNECSGGIHFFLSREEAEDW